MAAELDEVLGRTRYQRPGTADGVKRTDGYRHGRRERRLLGSFGPVTIKVPRARLNQADGTHREWRSEVLPRYARMTKQVEALIAGAYLSGTNTRRVRRALGPLFKGAVSKDTVSRTWRKVQTDWTVWCRRSLAEEDVVRLILDGTVVRVRLDRKATSISLLVVLCIGRDGQKVLLAVRNMGGESEAAWRSLLDDLVSRGLPAPGFVMIDGAAGLEKALGLVWPEALVQRCTVHKHRNLLAHAPERLHEEISADYNDMIYAGTPKEIEARRRSFIRKWRLKCRAVADSLEEAGDRLFTFTRLPDSQWRSARTTDEIKVKSPQTNGICERFHKTLLDEFHRVAFRKKVYDTPDALQNDLDEWMAVYNEQRTHQGRWCFGKTPMQTFLDSAEWAREKQNLPTAA